MATVWKRLEPKSRDGYVAGIRRYLGVLCRQPNLGVQVGLEEAVLQVMQAGHYEGPNKKILAIHRKSRAHHEGRASRRLTHGQSYGKVAQQETGGPHIDFQ